MLLKIMHGHWGYFPWRIVVVEIYPVDAWTHAKLLVAVNRSILSSFLHSCHPVTLLLPYKGMQLPNIRPTMLKGVDWRMLIQ
jgi:hypothetical protein